MIFAGQGLVRMRGKKIANFMDGLFETNNPKVIQRLTMLGFKTVEPEQGDIVTESSRHFEQKNKKKKNRETIKEQQ